MAKPTGQFSWDEEADIVILGFGLAGACAAIESIDLNSKADVLIIEKMPEGREGGNSRVSGQSLWPGHDVKAVMDYQRRLNEPNPIPEKLLRTWAEAVCKIEPWVKRMAAEVGAEFAIGSGPLAESIFEFEEYGAREAVPYNATIKPLPSGVWLAFREHVRRRPIRTMFGTRATELIQDPETREVRGVRVDRDGRILKIKARRGVVMCTGGFENNLQMQRDYWGVTRAYPFGSPGNTGDGIHMLQKAGADLWHMRNQTQSGGLWPAIKVDDFQTAFMRNIHMRSGSWIEVAADNSRFYDEGTHHRFVHFHRKHHGVWNDFAHWQVQPIHMILDETTRLTDRLGLDPTMTWAPVVEGYRWSERNDAEIQKGWITKAMTLEDLARAIGRDPKALAATVQRYNEAAEKGHDADFGRPAEMMSPIIKPPFYAVEIVPGIITTTGGGRRNERAQVLQPDGTPIPRLYEAGELGSIIANLYQNGSFLVEAMVFGRIAAGEIANLKPWGNTEEATS